MIEPTKAKSKKAKRREQHATPVSDSQARKTALVVAAVVFAIGLWNLYQGRPTLVVVFVESQLYSQ